MPRSISTIARDISSDWTNPYFGAVPYMQAMRHLNAIDDSFYNDDARSVVLYFLANASAWRGATARAIKAELKAMLGKA